jgi:tRNA threonylcarbamoyladenosine biosynthesis protein TsaB
MPEVRAGAAAIARLAAPRLAAGEGVDAAQAAPVYVRDKVALTIEERRDRV